MSGSAKRAQRALRRPLDGGVSFNARALRSGALGIGSRRQPTQYPWCELRTPLARCAVVLKYPATKRGGDLKQRSRQERQAKTREQGEENVIDKTKAHWAGEYLNNDYTQ